MVGETPNALDNSLILLVLVVLNKSSIWMVKRVLEEFYSMLNEDADLLFSENKGRGNKKS